VKRETARIWRDGPFLEWCEQIGTSELEGLRSRFADDDPHWAEMRAWGPDFRRRSWRDALADCGLGDTELTHDLHTRFEAERAAANRFIPGALEALDALPERYHLAIVTNGIPEEQRGMPTAYMTFGPRWGSLGPALLTTMPIRLKPVLDNAHRGRWDGGMVDTYGSHR
jgi:FMN phosphatase YigB (HAD superfamily)